ncbi:hypothetical protein WJX73_006578 [Symbiochloris irregularis]|uniref:J domain-containing protein n=1 Tax=Symbiochloris irregularis TaxID=706552 RepID=A0AAW1NPP6_9CHLO
MLGRSLRLHKGAQHRAALCLELSCFATGSATSSASHYDVLGVSETAGTDEIKHAFRQKAKTAHPDATTGSAVRFRELLTAYQVLATPHSRQLYDLGRRPDVTAFVRSASAQHDLHAADSVNSDQDLARGEGWLAWATTAPEPTGNANIDRWRGSIHSEIRSAVKHAYLGPRLNLNPGELPAQFEGEERSDPSVGDLLQLVSGRTLLGVVKQPRTVSLPSQTEHLPGGTHPHHRIPVHRKVAYDAIPSHAGSNSQVNAAHERKATAVRSRITSRYQPGVEQAQRRGIRLHDSETTVYDQSGQIAASFAGQRVHWRGVEGRVRSLAVFKRTSPMVRHIDFYALNGRIKRAQCVVQCKRAWLPPSSTWLFPPRSSEHAKGGWYFEWPGHDFIDHPLCPPPHVFVLLAAFESLDLERQEADKWRSGFVEKLRQRTRELFGGRAEC